MAEGPVTISRHEERLANSKARWYFTKDELMNSPSREHNVDPAKELSYRQQAANLIQDMGHRLTLSQLCTATAIVYMHRFFIVHSFKSFQRFNVATAALFLAAKVEEQPRKLEYVARVSYSCQNRDTPPLDAQSDTCKKLMEEISYNELLILETLGFEVAVEHPHQHVVKGTQLVRASKDLSQTAYFMSHNSLLLTTFCLQYRPTVVACVCIHLACQWKGIEIPLSADGKNWWEYVDPNITLDELNDHTGEFLKIYEMCPSRLRKKIMESMKMGQQQTKREPSNPGPSMSRTLTSGDKSKAPLSHPSKHQSQTNQSQAQRGVSGKTGSGIPSYSSSHLHKHHVHVPSKHLAHPQQGSVDGNAIKQDSKQPQQHSRSTLHHQHQKTSTSSSSGGRVPPGVRDDHHRLKAGTEVKHSNSSQSKHHSHTHHHHHHQAAPGHIPNAAKPTDVPIKHRPPPSTGDHKQVMSGIVDHKHSTSGELKHRSGTSNHEGRHHNPLKRAHPGDSMDVKRMRMEQPSTLPPLPAEPSSPSSLSFHLPPLPTQLDSMSLPPLPPPLPSGPPPKLWGREFSPPPPPPPN